MSDFINQKLQEYIKANPGKAEIVGAGPAGLQVKFKGQHRVKGQGPEPVGVENTVPISRLGWSQAAGFFEANEQGGFVGYLPGTTAYVDNVENLHFAPAASGTAAERARAAKLQLADQQAKAALQDPDNPVNKHFANLAPAAREKAVLEHFQAEHGVSEFAESQKKARLQSDVNEILNDPGHPLFKRTSHLTPTEREAVLLDIVTQSQFRR